MRAALTPASNKRYMQRQSFDYRKSMSELQAILADMQSQDLDVESALAKYERGHELIAALQKYLADAENTVVKRTASREAAKAE